MKDRLDHTATAIMLFILDYHQRHGRGPRYSELMAETHLSKSALHSRLKRLRSARLIEWQPGQHGTLRPIVRMVAL